jgi:hypothetical protein
MPRKIALTLFVLAWLVTACGGPTPTSTVIVTEAPLPGDPAAYPSPLDRVEAGNIPWYPAPGTPGAPAEGAIMTTGYEPQLSDADLSQGEIFLELESSQIIIMESFPIQVVAVVNGNLPDPCHLLRIQVTAAGADNRINIDIYSLVDPNITCTTDLQPFTANIPLGTYAGGQFSVYVNGDLLGEFDS